MVASTVRNMPLAPMFCNFHGSLVTICIRRLWLQFKAVIGQAEGRKKLKIVSKDLGAFNRLLLLQGFNQLIQIVGNLGTSA